MCAEENKALIRRLYERFTRGNMDVVDETVSSHFVLHDPAHPGQASGPEGIKRVVAMYRTAFPDLHITVEDQIAEEDKVVVRWTARGTHQGALFGSGPTGQPLTVTGIVICRMGGGKIEEAWLVWDALRLRRSVVMEEPRVPYEQDVCSACRTL